MIAKTQLISNSRVASGFWHNDHIFINPIQTA